MDPSHNINEHQSYLIVLYDKKLAWNDA